MAGGQDQAAEKAAHSARLGKIIRQLREDRGMPQDKVPGVYPYWVSDIERGKRNPSWESLERLLRGLNVSAEEFGRAWDASGSD